MIFIRVIVVGRRCEEMKPDLSRVTFIEEKERWLSTNIAFGMATELSGLQNSAKRRTETALMPGVGAVRNGDRLPGSGTGDNRKRNIKNVKLEARPKDVKRNEYWLWADNPLSASRIQGLKIIMVLINNWDMKDDNNASSRPRRDTSARRYITVTSAPFRKTAESFRAVATNFRLCEVRIGKGSG